MPQVFIGVGSNLGDRGSAFRFAACEILPKAVAADIRFSPVYETEPVGAEGQPLYWNAVWSFETELPPQPLLSLLHEVEAKAGRCRHVPNEARVLDLDLLFYGDSVIKENDLTVPHPRLQDRAFVLLPFCDLAPDFIHPLFQKSMKDLLDSLRANYGAITGVTRLSEKETVHP